LSLDLKSEFNKFEDKNSFDNVKDEKIKWAKELSKYLVFD
jgi:hypothetical protein